MGSGHIHWLPSAGSGKLNSVCVWGVAISTGYPVQGLGNSTVCVCGEWPYPLATQCRVWETQQCVCVGSGHIHWLPSAGSGKLDSCIKGVGSGHIHWLPSAGSGKLNSVCVWGVAISTGYPVQGLGNSTVVLRVWGVAISTGYPVQGLGNSTVVLRVWGVAISTGYPVQGLGNSTVVLRVWGVAISTGYPVQGLGNSTVCVCWEWPYPLATQCRVWETQQCVCVGSGHIHWLPSAGSGKLNSVCVWGVAISTGYPVQGLGNSTVCVCGEWPYPLATQCRVWETQQCVCVGSGHIHWLPSAGSGKLNSVCVWGVAISTGYPVQGLGNSTVVLRVWGVAISTGYPVQGLGNSTVCVCGEWSYPLATQCRVWETRQLY